MKLKRPHFDKLKSLTKKQKKLILAGIALFLLILAASYTVFIAPLLQKEQWIYKEETVERGTLKVGVTESGSLEYNTKSIDYNLDLDVSDDDEDDSEEDDDDTVQKYLKIEEIYAASGQRVTEGEELLKFTEDSVEAVRALLQNAVVEAQADYAEAESTYELSLLEAQTDWSRDAIFEACKQKAEAMEKKNGWLLFPLGIALSGKARTPGGGTDLAAMMGREETLKRVKDALGKL